MWKCGKNLHSWIKPKLKETLQRYLQVRMRKYIRFPGVTHFPFRAELETLLLFAITSLHNYLLKINSYASSSSHQTSGLWKQAFPEANKHTQGPTQHSPPTQGSRDRRLWLKPQASSSSANAEELPCHLHLLATATKTVFVPAFQPGVLNAEKNVDRA